MYFYNDMQDDINEMVKDALKKTAWKECNKAAPTLYYTMMNIMQWNITKSGWIVDIIRSFVGWVLVIWFIVLVIFKFLW
jgi:hypothetical protein